MISQIEMDDTSETPAQDEAPERIWAASNRTGAWAGCGGWSVERNDWDAPMGFPDAEYVRSDLARPSQARDESVARLVEAAKAVVDGALDTYRAGNGKLMGIEADDGEKCEIVHSDLMHWLRSALAAMDTPKGGGDE